MTYEQVKAILGEGVLLSGGLQTVYRWYVVPKDDSKGYIEVVFNDSGVINFYPGFLN